MTKAPMQLSRSQKSYLPVLKYVLRDIEVFSRLTSGLRLRRYQVEVARAIVDSVIQHKGLSFVVIFPRQSGKNELQAQIETYLLTLLSGLDAEIVKISPTWKPQSLNAMRRLERVLKKNLFTRVSWRKEQGFIYCNESARIFFYSGSPTANVVGATASTLLECDEAQDVQIAKWDKEINPMAASTNATRVFWGTAWSSQTLLAREKRTALEAQRRDGIQRVFELTADDVGEEVPPYRDFVQGEIQKHGREHPYIRTQYFSEEIDNDSGMFPAGRLALLAGSHERSHGPLAGRTYVFLIDVAGQEETAAASAASRNGERAPTAGADPLRDATALTIVEIDFSTLADELVRRPTYRVTNRQLWQGVKHTRLFSELTALAQLWQPRHIVIDATGLGEGLYSFLDKALPNRVIPFKFSLKSKSDLGWTFLSIIESGRLKDWKGEDAEKTLFMEQAQAAALEALPGPGRLIHWGVPDGRRDPTSGEPVHDDLLLSLALVGVLEEQTWGDALSGVIPARDPLQGFSSAF